MIIAACTWNNVLHAFRIFPRASALAFAAAESWYPRQRLTVTGGDLARPVAVADADARVGLPGQAVARLAHVVRLCVQQRVREADASVIDGAGVVAVQRCGQKSAV